MAAIAGLRGTGDWGTDERPKNFREGILFMNPNGATPLTGLMSRVAKRTVDDPEFNWWNEPVDIFRLQANGALGSGDTLITVDSADPSAGSLDVRWGTARHLVPGDVILVEPSADAATYDHEQLLVTSVISDTQFTVTRGFAGTTPAAIGDDAFLLRIGSAHPEGTGAAQAATRNPIKSNNFLQIFKTTYELTGTATQTNLRTGDPVQVDKRRKSMDHAQKMEMAFLWGKKSEVNGSNGKPMRTTQGIRDQIPASNVTILAANWTVANSAAAGNNLLDAISPVFDWDTEAGDQRVVFCGNGALNRMNAAIMKGTNVGASSINYQGSQSVFGMNFMKLQFPQGMVFLKTHPLLNRHPIWNNSMFVLDFSAIKYVAMKGRDTKSMDNIQNKDEDLRRGQWIGEVGLQVDRGGLTQGYIGGFDNTIA